MLTMPYPGVSNQISREMDSGIRCIFAVLQRESGFEVRGVTGTAAAFRDIHHSLPLRPPALEDQGSRVDYPTLAFVRARILNQNQTDSGVSNRFRLNSFRCGNEVSTAARAP